MAARMKSETGGKSVDWGRWLHDPKHWEHFYDELAIETYTAVARRLWDGCWPDEAVEMAVEDISAKMRAEAVPEKVVVSYRDEYFKHLGQLKEIAGEIADVMPCGSAAAAPPQPCQTEMSALAQSPLTLPFWLIKTYWGGVANCLRDAQAWLHEVEHGPERRHPDAEQERPALAGPARRRRRDVNVERL